MPTNPRFRVLSHYEVPVHLRGCRQPAREYWHDCHNALVECDGDKPVRIVAWDGGEPEDQTLTRDWSWVVHELNKLAQEVIDKK